jgi:hypothetical protein
MHSIACVHVTAGQSVDLQKPPCTHYRKSKGLSPCDATHAVHQHLLLRCQHLVCAKRTRQCHLASRMFQDLLHLLQPLAGASHLEAAAAFDEV